MSLLLVLALLTVLGGIAVVASGRGGSFDAEPPDRSPTGLLAEGELAPADIEELRFSVAFRGYRMDEVDAVLERLAGQLADAQALVEELQRGRHARVASAGGGDAGDADDARTAGGSGAGGAGGAGAGDSAHADSAGADGAARLRHEA